MACQPSQSASTSGRVNAEDYDAFWIWGNISSAPYLKAAKEIYILQGEIRLDSQTHHSKLIPQGVSVLTIPQQKVWLVFRNYHLDWQWPRAYTNSKTRSAMGKCRESYPRHTN